jgi:hypothetical protein
MKKQDQNNCQYPRLLTSEETDKLLMDAKDSSAWMRAEIKRRRADESGSLIIEEKQ